MIERQIILNLKVVFFFGPVMLTIMSNGPFLSSFTDFTYIHNMLSGVKQSYNCIYLKTKYKYFYHYLKTHLHLF